MKKYRFVSNEIQNVLNYFAYNTEIDYITVGEMNSVLSYLDTLELKYKKKCFLLVTDDYQVISIINPIRQTCYIYSNCGINFNIYQYMNDLLRYQHLFSSIACDRGIYDRIKLFLDDSKILIVKNKPIYSLLDSEFIKHENIIEIANNSILLNQLSFSILSNIFCKVIDNEHLFFINQQYVGVLKVDNTETFIEKFYQIELSESTFEVNENYNIIGQILLKNEDVLIYDLDLNIKSILIIRNADSAFEIIFADTIKENLRELFEILINTIKIKKPNLYFVERKEINISALKALGFTKTNEKVYFYLSHPKCNLSPEFIEIRDKLERKFDYKALLVKIIINTLCLASLIVLSYIFRNQENDLSYYTIGGFICIAISLPSLYVDSILFQYEQKKIRLIKYNFSKIMYFLNVVLLEGVILYAISEIF